MSWIADRNAPSPTTSRNAVDHSASSGRLNGVTRRTPRSDNRWRMHRIPDCFDTRNVSAVLPRLGVNVIVNVDYNPVMLGGVFLAVVVNENLGLADLNLPVVQDFDFGFSS
jgi:hypothetical protein